MSRVIKFRAWNPYQNRMMPAFTPYQMGCFPAQCFDHLMQFTGLTDCNGVEIYEGDIVKAFCNINKISDPELTEREPEYDLRLVSYMKGGFVLSTEKYNFCGVLGFNRSTIPSYLTVVGNIYEHPHLLDRSSA